MGVGRPKGYRMPKASREAISKKMTGRKKTDEQKQRIAEGVKKHREKIRRAQQEAIWKLYNIDEYTAIEISEMLGLSRKRIHQVLRGMNGYDDD